MEKRILKFPKYSHQSSDVHSSENDTDAFIGLFCCDAAAAAVIIAAAAQPHGRVLCYLTLFPVTLMLTVMWIIAFRKSLLRPPGGLRIYFFCHKQIKENHCKKTRIKPAAASLQT